jgi:hypothetical protein
MEHAAIAVRGVVCGKARSSHYLVEEKENDLGDLFEAGWCSKGDTEVQS